ncbi:glutamate receptor 1-like [Dermacentor silvarum]|uniref:glutamate receptor 1-like n=1 Tax=Dermacentor silvarum TaxID=543639 RepID=UPI0021018D86|nr:glutamate receptor 1-like [Dermacentor silvarum]
MAYSVVSTEATAEPPRRGGQRLLSTVWWLATLVLMNAFCGHMRACLMIKSEVEKIESAEDLIRRPQTVPYMWKGTSYVATVTNSTNPALRKLGRIVGDRGTAVPVQVLYGRPLLEKVAQGRAAIISDATSLAFQVSSKCRDFIGAEYYLAREGLVSHPLNSFARKDIDPELFDNINKVIRRLLEAGLVTYWWGLAMGEMGRCGGSLSSSGPEQPSTLTFDDVLGVFVLWLACVAASCLTFLAETSVPGAMHRTTSKVNVTGDIFDLDDYPLRQMSVVTHRINTGDASPIHRRPYRFSKAEWAIAQKEVDKIMNKDIIEPLSSPWTSPVVLVKRNSWRF